MTRMPQGEEPRTKSPFRAGERIPPQNTEAEISVLGSLLIDHDAIVKVADFLRPADFYTPAHTTLYEAILDLYEHREPIDIVSLSNKLTEKKLLQQVGGESMIASLAASVPTAGHVEHYARIVQKKATLRRLISAAADITDLGFTEDEEIDVVLDTAEQKLFGVSQQHLRQTFVPVKSVLAEAFHRIDRLHKGGGRLRGVPTGFLPLDNLLSGLQKADLVIIAARPSVGKTSLALDMARHIAVREGVPTGIFSIEMSKEQLADRLICAEAGVDLWKMRTGRLDESGPDNDFARINHAMAILAEAPIYIDDSATNNVMEIRTLARRLQAEHHIGFLVIDYLQLMEGDNREGRVQEVSQISRALKNLARELDIPILAISQLSRAVEGRSPPIPKLSDLRDSGCVTGDTQILRADTGELVTIGELAHREQQDPLPVFAIDEHQKLVIRPLSKAFSSGEKVVYAVHTRTGRSITASANHPFYHRSGWKPLEMLRVGDHIALRQSLARIRANTSVDAGPHGEWRTDGERAKAARGWGWQDVATAEVSWDDIVAIEERGVQPVYDATVPGVHNFVANDFIIHNSIEQDSDVVIFLYQRGKHERTAESTNIVDAIIAKHRNGPTGVVSLFFREELASFAAVDTQRELANVPAQPAHIPAS